MRFRFTEEQEALAAAVRRLFATEYPPKLLRGEWDTETGRIPAMWDGLRAIGVPAVLVPEELGGLGGTLVDLCLVLEEAGRACVPDAVLEACVLGPSAVSQSEAGAEWARRIAAGEVRATTAFDGLAAVPDVHVSDVLIIADGDGVRLYERSEITATPLRSMDPSRRLFRVTVPPGAGVVLGRGPRAELMDLQSVGSASVLVGVAQELLDRTVAHVLVRRQFGRPLGSFQAVKHQLAQAATLVTMARLATHAATAAVAAGAGGAHDAARWARICAVDAEAEANRVALQLHGAIGFSWEHDLQHWLKRGKVLEQAHGGVETEVAGRAAIASLG
ncbi:acyl-CoA dehydrogenase family protein [Pseudonocardia sp. CA-107938]|uniref:acyl-CoA dehydrogenase family protein n=1 Tax=Pseudonocardia sp. CA-107938 TaxID=3240021 RepID=UPI003D8DD452